MHGGVLQCLGAGGKQGAKPQRGFACYSPDVGGDVGVKVGPWVDQAVLCKRARAGTGVSAALQRTPAAPHALVHRAPGLSQSLNNHPTTLPPTKARAPSQLSAPLTSVDEQQRRARLGHRHHRALLAPGVSLGVAPRALGHQAWQAGRRAGGEGVGCPVKLHTMQGRARRLASCVLLTRGASAALRLV